MKILYFGDSPEVATGLGQVSRTIMDALVYSHDVEIIAMNHWEEEHINKERPYTIYPCVSKDYRNVEAAHDLILKGEYDLFIYSADVGYTDIFVWLQEARKNHDFIVVAYVPVDCDNLHQDAFECLCIANIIATYTHHGKAVISRFKPDLADRTTVIPLACDHHLYFPLEQEERTLLRHELFGVDDDIFIVGTVDRNQPRKDLGRLMLYFHEYHEKINPKSVLYIHAAQNDTGGSLPAMALAIGMELDGPNREILFAHPDHSISQGLPDIWLNMIVNCFDCFASCTTGEGWGLTKLIAMCVGCPVLLPGNTANSEHVGTQEDRGWLMDIGGDLDHMQFLYGMVNYPRDIVHSASFLEKLDSICEHPEVAKDKAIIAKEWTEQFSLDKVIKMWDHVIAVVERNRS